VPGVISKVVITVWVSLLVVIVGMAFSLLCLFSLRRFFQIPQDFSRFGVRETDLRTHSFRDLTKFYSILGVFDATP
jgi:uncharacterized protein HemY